MVLVFVPSALLINVIGWTFLLLFIQVHSENSFRLPGAADFFDVPIFKIKWGHGINNRALLKKSLEGKDMMIEADVSMGTIKGKDGDLLLVPIMAHPPSKQSDLSLEEFLDTILDYHTPKGIKLDFKSIEVVESALEIVKLKIDKIKVPLWLNADIISGPVNATTQPVDAKQFLNLTKCYFPGAILSVGWTTRFGPDPTSWPLKIVNEGSYSKVNVQELHDTLNEFEISSEKITFPVRAGLLTSLESQGNIMSLLSEFPKSTLTIWSGIYDQVDVPALMNLIKTVGQERIYIDVPDGLHCLIEHYDNDEENL